MRPSMSSYLRAARARKAGSSYSAQRTWEGGCGTQRHPGGGPRRVVIQGAAQGVSEGPRLGGWVIILRPAHGSAGQLAPYSKPDEPPGLKARGQRAGGSAAQWPAGGLQATPARCCAGRHSWAQELRTCQRKVDWRVADATRSHDTTALSAASIAATATPPGARGWYGSPPAKALHCPEARPSSSVAPKGVKLKGSNPTGGLRRRPNVQGAGCRV